MNQRKTKDVCPRCDEVWSFTSEAYRRCDTCGMREGHPQYAAVYHILELDNATIYWDHQHCVCKVKGKQDTIQLPRLSLKVSKEELDKYLVLV